METFDPWQAMTAIATVVSVLLGLMALLGAGLGYLVHKILETKDTQRVQLEDANKLFSAIAFKDQFEALNVLLAHQSEEIMKLNERLSESLTLDNVDEWRPWLTQLIHDGAQELDDRHAITRLAMMEQLEKYREETGRDWALNIPEDAFKRSAEVRIEMEKRLLGDPPPDSRYVYPVSPATTDDR